MQRASTPADRENNCLIPNRRLTGLGFRGLGFGRVATSLTVGPSPVTIRWERCSEKSTNPNPLKPNPSAADAGGMAFSGYGRGLVREALPIWGAPAPKTSPGWGLPPLKPPA